MWRTERTGGFSRLWRDWAQPRKGGIFDTLRPYGLRRAGEDDWRARSW